MADCPPKVDLANECCDIMSDTSSSKSCTDPCATKKTQADMSKDRLSSCSNRFILSSSSTSSTVSAGAFGSECRKFTADRPGAPHIGYELAIAKSIMQQYSTLSGDNLFDHLSDIIKRVIDERPPNVIDFFEEFSRNVREQKYHWPDRFPPDAVYEESRAYRVAQKILKSMRLPRPSADDELLLDETEVEEKSFADGDLTLDLDGSATLKPFLTYYERVQHLQFYWNQCGFSISGDDIFQLACAMDRLQTHPSIMQCRFWGVINGMKSSYYIVETTLTTTELQSRLKLMEEEMRIKVEECACTSEDDLQAHIGPELTPGIYGWETHSTADMGLMKPLAAPVPLMKKVETFDIPPEPVGSGLNRYSYFVVNTFGDDWIELPIVTPKQIVISRIIKKFFTGDLETEIVSYPCFPGKEKHYLRAMIARITSGTYIAPRGYYRRMTRKEKRLFEGIEDDDEIEEEEEEDDFIDEDIDADNDVVLLNNESYEPQTLNELSQLNNWVHVRPAILKQGRIVWFNEEKARREREKELARLLKLAMAEEMGEEVELEDDEDELGEEEEELEDFAEPERGPPILTGCDVDESNEYTSPWVVRKTSAYTNVNERIIFLRSNVWPGAYTFTFSNVCESVYMGWGHKYLSRNLPFHHLPSIMEEYPHHPGDFMETNDPTVADEEAYRLYLLKRAELKRQMDYYISDEEVEHGDEMGEEM